MHFFSAKRPNVSFRRLQSRKKLKQENLNEIGMTKRLYCGWKGRYSQLFKEKSSKSTKKHLLLLGTI